MPETKKCKHCKSEINSKSKRCPECQGDLRIWPARHKIITGLGAFIVLIIIVVAASSSNKSGNTNSSAQNTSASSAAQSSNNTGQVGQPIRVGDIQWTVQSPKKQATLNSGNQFLSPVKANGTFVVISLTAEEVGNQMGTVDPSQLKVIDSKGRQFSLSEDGNVVMAIGSDKWIIYSQINPNVPKNFTGVFDVAADATGLKLQINSGGLTQRDKVEIPLGL